MIRTIAVTGVASGIGAALAARLRAEGHRVIGLDVREPPGNVDRFVSLNLDSPDSIDAAIKELDETLHGLCCNAGLPPRDGMEASILHVNFTGQRRFARGVMRRRAGSCVGARGHASARGGRVGREHGIPRWRPMARESRTGQAVRSVR